MVAPRKFYAVVIRKAVTMPATSTSPDGAAVTYTPFDFLGEWVLGTRGMRADDNLEHRFEWEDALEAFRVRVASKAGIERPEPPERTGDITADNAAAAAFNAAAEKYRTAVATAAEGERVYISEGAFKAACASAREAIGAGCERGPMGQPRNLHPSHEPKVLRLYHAMLQSKPILESEIPTETPAPTP